MTEQADAENQPKPKKKRSTKPKRTPTKKKKPSVFQRLRRQDIILLVGLASVACLAVIVVGLLILRFQSANARAELTSQASPRPNPTHTVSFVDVTGLKQYGLALEKARAWSEDAKLTSANANWPGVLSLDQVGTPVQWTYRFFSPGKERLFIVKVEPNGQSSSLEHIARITLHPPVIDAEQWAVDSPTALATWLDYGGATMLVQNPGLEVLIQLRHINESPNPVWLVVGTDQRTQDILIVTIDTVDGSVIRTDSSK